MMTVVTISVNDGDERRGRCARSSTAARPSRRAGARCAARPARPRRSRRRRPVSRVELVGDVAVARGSSASVVALGRRHGASSSRGRRPLERACSSAVSHRRSDNHGSRTRSSATVTVTPSSEGASTRPVTLNATWVSDRHAEPAGDSRHDPAPGRTRTGPGTRPGGSGSAANHADAASQARTWPKRRRTSAAAGRGRPAPRRSARRRRRSARAAPAMPPSPGRSAPRRSPQPVVGERVGPELLQRQVDERDQHELGQHADRHAEQVDGRKRSP